MNKKWFEQDDHDDDMYKTFVKNAKDYVDLQSQLLRLNLVEKLSQIFSFLVIIITGCLLLISAFIYFSMVFVIWMQSFTGSMVHGFLILGLLFIVLFILLFLLRKKILINPIIRRMSDILFSDSKKEVENEE